MNVRESRITRRVLLLATSLALLVAGCGEVETTLPTTPEVPGDVEQRLPPDLEQEFASGAAKSIDLIRQDGSCVPTDLVTLDDGGASLTFWPYTGTTLDGTPVDPINLVLAGEAEPVAIRAALLALDGDRTAFGFPPAYPFDAVWSDATGGDVQATWSAEEGWIGSVLQLQLGDYEPLRVHLRLFRAGDRPGGAGCWTLGGAHFEVMIPGTADHQVLSWEIAEQLVAADLARSGLLDPDQPLAPTGPINAAPSFRDIPPEIYNALPAELTALIGPPPPVGEPVPLASDGQGTILRVAGAAPVVAEQKGSSVVITYGQFVPRPFCSSGPYDWLHVSGPVEFWTSVRVDADGRYTCQGGYAGTLEAVPVDIATGEPLGPAFTAEVRGWQSGSQLGGQGRVLSLDKRLTLESGGPQIQFTTLQASVPGRDCCRAFARCLDDDDLF